jgi:hypothetical protein
MLHISAGRSQQLLVVAVGASMKRTLRVLACSVVLLAAVGVSSAAASQFSAVSAGGYDSCAIEQADGSVGCWGYGGNGQTDPPAGSYSAVSAGGFHTCAIKSSDSSIVCWGRDNYGQTDAPAGSYSAVSAGGFHTCAIKSSDSSIVCWGEADGGQTNAPAGSYRAVSAGYAHTCAIKSSDGSIVCWGGDPFGETNAPPGSYSAVSAGGFHTCAIKSSDGSIVCWGDDYSGKSDAPAGSYSAVGAGYNHACGIRSSDGSIVCWGEDYEGSTDAPSGSYSALSAGFYHACAIKSSDSSVVCWGDDDDGETDMPVANSDLSLGQPGDVSVNATSAAGATVNYPTPAASDEALSTVSVSCLPASGSTFATGNTTVTCTAIDTDGDTNGPVQKMFTVHVKGASEQLSDLAGAVKGVGSGSSLADKVAKIESYLASNDASGACSTLNAFVQEVNAQSGKKSISASTAATLTTSAQQVEAVIPCTK